MRAILLLVIALVGVTAIPAEGSGEGRFRPENYKQSNLILDTSRTNHLTVSKNKAGEYKVVTSGGDPYISVQNFAQVYDASKPYCIGFQYKVSKEVGAMTIYYKPKGNRVQHIQKKMGRADTWKWLLVDFSRSGEARHEEIEWIRLDFEHRGGTTYHVKTPVLFLATRDLLLHSLDESLVGKIGTFGVKAEKIEPSSSMETVRHTDSSSLSVVKSVYKHLDLDARTKMESKKKHNRALVPLGPVMVAGEGEHPDNHTVVRILSRYQTRENQFLAFPPKVRGGVGVNTLELGNGREGFICHPLSDTETRSVRIFNRYGGLVKSVSVKGLIPPFVVASGEFYSGNPGQEFAVASRYEPSEVRVYSRTGKELFKVPVPVKDRTEEGIHLAVLKTGGSARSLVYQDILNKKLYRLRGAASFDKLLAAESVPDRARVYPIASSKYLGAAVGQQEIVSHLSLLKKDGSSTRQDVGERENTFFYSVLKTHGGYKGEWPDFADGKYIKNQDNMSFFGAQRWSPLIKSGKIRNRSRKDWLTGIDWEARNFVDRGIYSWTRSFSKFSEGNPSAWNCWFSHRWRIRDQQALLKVEGEKGLPEYLLLDRLNETCSDGYFGQKTFTYGSYNFETPELQDFYHLLQWEFHRQLAVPYRRDAAHLTIVKPSHENEVISGAGSIGDYNLHNIRGFYRYLISLYRDLETINKVFGTSFTKDFFDPPRNVLRGSWDAYSGENPFFREWVEYSRVLVYRRVAESQLGVLLAGFPPQVLRSHQIPDKYTGPAVGIMENARRITPIDWFMTAGTGIGYTRYGLWVNSKRNFAQGAQSSGFDDIYNGEFASKTASEDLAWKQMEYAVNHGLKGALVMAWPVEKGIDYNKAMIASLKRLHREYNNKPLPGLAGGVSEVRPYEGAAGTFDICALGSTEKNTGLLKSVKEDGSFEGTVYVVPFHSHVDIETLAEKETLQVGSKPSKLCEIKQVRQGCVVEVTFTVAEAKRLHALNLLLKHGSVILPDQTVSLKNLSPGKRVRVTYRIPIIMQDLSLDIVASAKGLGIKDLQVYRHQDMAINLTRDIWEGNRHRGGVRFDILKK